MRLLALALLAALVAAQDSALHTRTNLKAGLYPFIPDPAGDGFAALDAFVSSTFSQANSDVNLHLAPTKDQINIYNSTALLQMLNVSDPNHFDVLQIDSMFLHFLVDNHLIAPIVPGRDVDTTSWTSQAIHAGTVNGQLYAQPQWHCGYFTFTRNAAVHNAGTSGQLLHALSRLNGGTQKFATSWDLFDLPVVYLAGVAQNAANPQQAVNNAIAPGAPIQRRVTDVLTVLTDDCVNPNNNNSNPCPYKDYSYSYSEFVNFAKSDIQSFMYYSEELNPVALNSPDGLDDVLFSVTPLGEHPAPFLTYTDVTVISKTCAANPACFSAAKRFAAFTWSNTFYDYTLRSKDAGANQPLRYLMPATVEAFEVEGVNRDRYYRTIKRALLGNEDTPPAIIIPNSISYQAENLYTQLLCIVAGYGC